MTKSLTRFLIAPVLFGIVVAVSGCGTKAPGEDARIEDPNSPLKDFKSVLPNKRFGAVSPGESKESVPPKE